MIGSIAYIMSSREGLYGQKEVAQYLADADWDDYLMVCYNNGDKWQGYAGAFRQLIFDGMIKGASGGLSLLKEPQGGELSIEGGNDPCKHCANNRLGQLNACLCTLGGPKITC